jgi:hypothetical protein
MTESTKSQGGTSGGGGVYGLGMIGAAVYYWQRADSDIGSRVRALGKAFVWPAFVVYEVLEHTSRDAHRPALPDDGAVVSRPQG